MVPFKVLTTKESLKKKCHHSVLCETQVTKPATKLKGAESSSGISESEEDEDENEEEDKKKTSEKASFKEEEGKVDTKKTGG